MQISAKFSFTRVSLGMGFFKPHIRNDYMRLFHNRIINVIIARIIYNQIFKLILSFNIRNQIGNVEFIEKE